MKNKNEKILNKFVITVSIIFVVFSLVKWFTPWIPKEVTIGSTLFILNNLAIYTLIFGVIGIIYYVIARSNQ